MPDWKVVSQTPTAATPPPPPPPGGPSPANLAAPTQGQWKVLSQNPTTAAATTDPDATSAQDAYDDRSYWDETKRRLGSNPHEFFQNLNQRVTDAGAGMGRNMDEAMLPIEHAIRATPLVGAILGRHAGLDAQIARDQAAVNAPLPTDPERRENIQGGAELGNLAEWETGAKLLDVAHAAVRGLPIAKQLAELAPIEKMLKGAPKSAAIIARSLKSGAVSGGQTLLHGGSATEALANATMTALGQGVVEGVPAAVGHAAETLRQPAPRNIAGEDYELLASDPTSVKGPGSKPATAFQTAAAEAGKERGVMEQRQGAAQRSMTNIAHDALDSEFSKVAAERTPPTATTDPGKLLPAPEPPPPQPFTIRTAGDIEPTREGTTAYDPRKKHEGTKVVEGKGPGKFDYPGYSPDTYNAEMEAKAKAGTLGAPNPQPEPQGSHREPIYQYLNAIKPGTEAPVQEGATGGGTVTFNGPEEASAALDRHNDIIDSPEFDRMDPADRKHIRAQRDSLQYQLDSYHAGLVDPTGYMVNVPHFPVPDVAAAKRNTVTLRDAANQIENLHRPVFQGLDASTRGQYDTLRAEEMALRKIIQNPTSVKAYNRAVERTAEIRQNYLDFFNDPAVAKRVSPTERQSAIDGYRKAQRLHELSDFVESAHNVSVPWSKRTGIERTFQPGANFQKGLEDVSERGGKDLQSLIGPEGAANIGRIADMVSTPEKQAAYKGLIANIGGILKRNYHGIGGLKGVGAGVGAEAVLGTLAPAAAGAAASAVGGTFLGASAAEGATRHVLNKLATDAAFNKRVHYAVTNNVPPRIYVPLLTMMLQKDLEEKEQDRKDAEEEKNAPSE